MNAGQSFALWKNIATFAPNMSCLSLCKRPATACGTPVEPVSVLERQWQARIEAGSNNSHRPKNIFV